MGEPGLWWSAHITLLFPEYPYLERPGAAARAGFRWIETAWPEVDASDVAEAIVDAGVTVACLNSYAGDVWAGDRGIINDPGRTDEAHEAFRAAVDLAAVAQARTIHVLLGRDVPGVPRAKQRETAIAALRDHAAVVRGSSVRIVVEPVNELDSPGYLASTIAAVDDLLNDVGCDELRILFDAYHVARSGDDVRESIRRYGDRIGHAQFSDWPGRGAPGTGRLDIDSVTRALAVAGYEGPVGLEWTSQRPTEVDLAALPSLDHVVPLRPW